MVKRIGGLLLLLTAVAGLIGFARPSLYSEFRSADPPTIQIEPPFAFRALVVLPDDGADAIIDELDAARSSIDLYVYLLPSEEILSTLARAHERNVSVRVVLERDPFGGGNSNQGSYDRLRAMGIEVRWAEDQFRFSHIKMVLVDGTTAVIMTLNLSYSALTLNREFAVITTDPDDVRQVMAIFEADWTDSAYAPSAPIVTSPDNSRAVIVSLIGSATQSIDIYAEVIRDREIRTRLIEAAAGGVRVRILVPEHPAGEDEIIYREMMAGGIEVRLLADVYSHAKAIVIDGERVFIGSQNLTETSLDDNRELGIVLSEPANIARLTSVFESDWANSPIFA